MDTVTEAAAVVAPVAVTGWTAPICALPLLVSINVRLPGMGGKPPVVAVTVAVMVTGAPNVPGPPVGAVTVSAVGVVGEVMFCPADIAPEVKLPLMLV